MNVDTHTCSHVPRSLSPPLETPRLPYHTAGAGTSQSRCHGHSLSLCGWSPAPPSPAPRPLIHRTSLGGCLGRGPGLLCQAHTRPCCSILHRATHGGELALGVRGVQALSTGARADTRTGLTLPPRGASGLDADLYQNVFCCSLLPAVVGCDRQLVLVFLPVV